MALALTRREPVRSAPRGTRPDIVAPQPRLTVVSHRRRFAWFAVAVTVLVGAVMIGAVLLHTTIAERQLEIDALEQSLRSAQEEFDVLRAQRAELRSPTRVAERAAELGMVPGQESDFLPVDPMVLAVTIARTGEVPMTDDLGIGSNAAVDPLDQFRLVKSVSAEAP